MRVFLAGPMTGIPEHNYPSFAEAVAELRAEGYEVVSPHEIEGGLLAKRQASWKECMALSITAMMTCEKVFTMIGWSASRGAGLEVYIANALEIPVESFLGRRKREKPMNNEQDRRTEERRADQKFYHMLRDLHGDALVSHLLDGIRLEIRAHSKNTAKWLGVIALAVATPDDNSAEIQKKIDEFTASLSAEADALEDAAATPE